VVPQSGGSDHSIIGDSYRCANDPMACVSLIALRGPAHFELILGLSPGKVSVQLQ